MLNWLAAFRDWVEQYPLAIELIGGLLLALVIVLPAPLVVRATLLSAGYELLVDRNNPTLRAAVVDFVEREAAILAAFGIRALLL